MTQKRAMVAAGRVVIEVRRSDVPNKIAIREAAKEVARVESKGMTASAILERIKTAR